MAVRFLAALMLCTSLVAAAVLSGCSTRAGNTSGILTWQPETDAERRLREQSENLQSTVGEGSLIGSAAGGAIGLLAGAQGAFHGAKIGQFIGAGAGNYLSSLQATYAQREEVLERIADDISTTNHELEEILKTMRQILEEHEMRIAALRIEISAGRAGRTEMQEQRDKASRNLDEIGNAIEAAEARRSFFSEARELAVKTPEDAEQLDPYLAILSERISAMRDIAMALATDL